MRIAVVSRYFPSSAEPWQGRSAYQTLRLLARRTELKVFFPNAMYPPLLKPHSRIYNALDTTFTVPDVDVQYSNYLALPLVSRPFSGATIARKLLPQIRAFAPDLVFGVFLYPEAYAGLRIARALRVPAVAMTIGSDINRIGDRFSQQHTRTLLEGVDALVAVSDDLRRKAVRTGAREELTRTLHNGCDLNVFYPRDRNAARASLGLDVDAESIVYIGRMDRKKGLVELVEAAAELHGERPKLQVYMVGEGPDRGLVEEAIAAHGARDYVRTLPACKPDDVAVWMGAADVVTLPSYMEGCPNVVVEALACGRPVVATNVGGIPEILSETYGRLVAARDAGELAEGLRSALEQPWDAAVISANAGRSWDAVADELEQVFQQAVARYGAASVTGKR